MITIIFLILINIFLTPFIKKDNEKIYNFIFPDRWTLNEDNALFMYKYCLEKNIKNVRLICIKNKKNINILKKHNIHLNDVVWFGSFNCIKKMSKINKAYYSHSQLHCYPTYFQFKKFKANKYYFIGHGINLLKNHSINKKNHNYTFIPSEIIFCSLSNVCDDFLKIKKFNIVCNSMLFTHYFYLKNNCNNKKIIYIPTWVRCKNYKDFKKTHIVKQIEFLKNKGIDFDIYPHKYSKKYLEKYLKRSKLKIVNKSVFEIICEYSICYSDNSSVLLDFLFLNKKAFVVNKFFKSNRMTDYRKKLTYCDIVELKNLQFYNELDDSWI